MTNSSGSRKPQVFINFRGKAQRNNLVSFLKSKLEEISDIDVFMDEYEVRGRPITTLFERIRESSIALVIFSNQYPESCWCLDELVEIKKQMDLGSLVPLPIFYKVEAENVKKQSGYFRNTLLKTEDYVREKDVDRSSFKSILETDDRIWGWRQALVSVCGTMGFSYNHKNDDDFVKEIVGEVKKMLSSPRNYLISIEKRPMMHPQEAVTSFLLALNFKKSDLEDLITRPSIHINGVVSQFQSTDHLVFLDFISLKNPIFAPRLTELLQAGKTLLVLLGSLEYYNKGYFFKRLFLPKKSQRLPDCTSVAGSIDNLGNREVDNSNAALTCFLFLCDMLKHFALKIDPPPRRVFISFGEKHLGKFILNSVKEVLESDKMLVYVEDETKSRIKGSGVAIVVFSADYPKSEKCLDELVEIKKLMDAGEIDPFPVFYNLKDEAVKKLTGWFRNRLLKIENEVRKNVKRRDYKSILDIEAKIWEWRQALLSIASCRGLSYNKHSTDDVFVSDIVTRVKEIFASRERQKTEAATTVVNDGLFYSITSFLQAIDREITDFKGFTDILNGLVLLRLKGHNNYVFLKLSSHENLVRFQRSDSFKFHTEVFALNPSGIIRFEDPSLALALESNQSEQWSDKSTTLNNQYALYL